MRPLSWTVPIEVSDHAVERACERFGWADDRDGEIQDRIRGELRSAIIADRVATTRPNWTHGATNDGSSAAPTAAYFVWDENTLRCWVVYLHYGVLRVASALEAYDRFLERGERGQRLRPGLGYA